MTGQLLTVHYTDQVFMEKGEKNLLGETEKDGDFLADKTLGVEGN